MAEALWWTFQQMHTLPEERKILLILSDGDPDNFNETVNALKAAREQQYEVYGIGMETTAMSRLLPGNLSREICDIKDLASAMFDILRNALVNKQ